MCVRAIYRGREPLSNLHSSNEPEVPDEEDARLVSHILVRLNPRSAATLRVAAGEPLVLVVPRGRITLNDDPAPVNDALLTLFDSEGADVRIDAGSARETSPVH